MRLRENKVRSIKELKKFAGSSQIKIIVKHLEIIFTELRSFGQYQKNHHQKRATDDFREN